MARRINSRLKISGTLQAETPLHIGGYGVDVETDLPLARNGRGELYIPGTSLTGVLRVWCEKNFSEIDENKNEVPIKLIGELFGPKRKQGVEEGHASFVLIEDSKITLPKNLQTEIRDSVGIDRIYGTAADKSKFDRAILPKGSTLEFEMTVEIEAQKVSKKNGKAEEERKGETEDEFKNRIKETKAIIGHLLTALSNQEIRCGASKTRGLGRVKLIELDEVQTQDFHNILSWIASDGKGAKLTDETAIKSEIDKLDLNGISKQDLPRLKIDIYWEPRLPLMNKAGYEGIGVDMLPVTSGVGDEKLSLVLAGSAIKGAFRSHAERIMRTLLNKTAEDKNFIEQIDDVSIVEELFGARKKTPNDKDDETEKNRKAKLGLAVLSIDDCYSVESFNQKEWRDVEQGTAKDDISAEDWEISKTIKTVQSKMTHQTEIQNPHFHITHHTAIDRFKGGVAEGALYSVLAPQNIEWQPIKMSLDFVRTNGKEKCCLMLLLLVLRDLAENRLPLGFATNRGMGEVKVKSIKLKGVKPRYAQIV